MRIAAAESTQWVLNFERGEELVSSLLAFCREQSVESATLTGLGAADQLELAYYNLSTKTYERHQIQEEVEILSLVGNVAYLAEEHVLHIHGVFGKRDLTTFGGHLFSLRVSGACEVHLASLSKRMTRAKDTTTGLNLLCNIA